MNALTLMRWPLSTVLKSVEPQVKVILGVLALCPALLAFFFRFLTDLPHVPFLEMLGFSAACGLLLMAYLALLRVQRRPRHKQRLHSSSRASKQQR